MNDLDEFKDLNTKTVHRNAPRCQEFTSAIAEVQQIETTKHLTECKFPAVIIEVQMVP